MNRLRFTTMGEHPLLELVRDFLILEGFELTNELDIDFVLVGALGQTYTLPTADVPVLCISTGDIYESSNLKKPVDEGRPPFLFPLGHLAYTSWKVLGNEIWASRNSKHMIIRIFDTYGPGAPASRLSRLVRESVELVPHSTRSYLHISDFRKGFLKLVNAFLFRRVTGIYNLGSDTPVDNERLNFLVKSVLGIEPAVQDTLDHWVCPFLVPDLTRTKAVTHWEPQVTLGSGLADFKATYKETY